MRTTRDLACAASSYALTQLEKSLAGSFHTAVSDIFYNTPLPLWKNPSPGGKNLVLLWRLHVQRSLKILPQPRTLDLNLLKVSVLDTREILRPYVKASSSSTVLSPTPIPDLLQVRSLFVSHR